MDAIGSVVLDGSVVFDTGQMLLGVWVGDLCPVLVGDWGVFDSVVVCVSAVGDISLVVLNKCKVTGIVLVGR